jgi:hypothetical protein
VADCGVGAVCLFAGARVAHRRFCARAIGNQPYRYFGGGGYNGGGGGDNAYAALPGVAAGAIALYFYDQEREMTRVEQLQRFLWRVDGKMVQGRQYTAVYTARLARPFITIHSFIAGVRQLLYRLRYYLFNK